MKKINTIIFVFLLSSVFLFSGCDDHIDFSEESEISVSNVTESSDTKIIYEVSKEIPWDTREESIERIDDYDTKYFIPKLDDNRLRYFAHIYSKVKEFSDDINFGTEIKSSDLDIMMYLLNYDCPELIQISGDYIPKYADEEQKYVTGVRLSYIMEKDAYKNAFHLIDQFMSNLKTAVSDKGEAEIERYVYDSLFENTVYDETDTYSGSIYGALINHKARCEGLCKSFMYCMRNFNIECLCVSGTPLWDSESVYTKHSWNIVKINGQYYHIDITADNIKTSPDDKNPPTYGYYNVSDQFISNTHQIDKVYIDIGLPECNDDEGSYHKVNGLYISETENLKTTVMNMMSEHFIDGIIDNVSIKFESKENYDSFVENMETYIKEFLLANTSVSYRYSTYSNEPSQTVIIYIGPSEQSSNADSTVSDGIDDADNADNTDNEDNAI